MTFINGIIFLMCFITGALICYFCMIGEYALAALVGSWVIFIFILYFICYKD